MANKTKGGKDWLFTANDVVASPAKKAKKQTELQMDRQTEQHTLQLTNIEA